MRMTILDIASLWSRRLVPGFLLVCIVSAQSINEYQLKAAFLYNFAKFVEWPAQTFNDDKDPMRICVLGTDPFGSSLTDIVSGKILSGRSFVVTSVSDTTDAARCQILFISSSERKRLKSVFAGLRTTGILTVGETEGFATEGGIVNFKLEAGRIVFEINVDAATQANLRISSKVLNLAHLVRAR